MLFRRKHTGKKIAVCLGDGCGLGNLLQALPAVQALHEMGNICDLFLSGFMYDGIADVVRGQPYVRDIYENTYDNREGTYDVCIVSFLSDNRVRNAKKYFRLRRDWEKRSEYGQYCRAAEKFGAKGFNRPQLNIADRRFNLQSPHVLLHAGCTNRKYWERRKWNHYEELTDLLLKDGFHVYCCGTADERVNHPGVAAFTDLPIQETAALISQCDLFLSNDSGLMHLAAALRKTQIAIFTATSDKKSGPSYNTQARVLRPALDCYPCYGNEREWNACTRWHCRDAITVAEVYESVRVMAAAEPRRSKTAAVNVGRADE
jgi:ADP-heptose:LPS heptosyltransferase